MSSSPRYRGWVLLLVGSLALLFAMEGQFNFVGEDHVGGEPIAYLLEVGLPFLVLLVVLWMSLRLWRGGGAES